MGRPESPAHVVMRPSHAVCSEVVKLKLHTYYLSRDPRPHQLAPESDSREATA